MNNLTTLHAVDYIILAIILTVSIGIGVYFARFSAKQQTTAEYFKSSGKMNIIPVFMSMLATFISSSLVIGIPTEVYYYGFNYCYSALGPLIGGPIAIYGMLPIFSNLKITSKFEYIEYRFNKPLRIFSSLMDIITFILLTSFAIYAPAIALSQTSGISVWPSILATIIVGTVYSSIGGIKAVIWTDVLQFIVFSSVVLVTVIYGIIDVGGMSFIVEKNIKGGRLDVPNFSLDPRIRLTVWGLLSQSTVRGIMICVSQTQLQRYLCCKNAQAARRSVWLHITSTVPVTLTYCFVGLILYSKYWNCDPLSSQQIQRPDQIYPLYVMQTVNSIPGMPGLFIAALYSAGLSTMSSQLNSMAAISLEDHIKPRCKNLTERKATFIAKCLVIGYGIICLLMIVIIMNLGNMISSMYYLLGGTYGSILGLFTLGLMNPWANSKGSAFGIICGLGISWWITIGNLIYRPIPNSKLPLSLENCSYFLGNWTRRREPIDYSENISEIYKVSYVWIIPIAFLVSIIVGSLSSLFIGVKKDTDLKLLSPFVHSIMKKFFSKKYVELQNKCKHRTEELNREQEIKMINYENVKEIL